jgi:predicted metalloprotease with PDZ domain
VGQNRQFHIDYTVDVSNPETGRFRVTANVQNLNQPRLDLSLPVWTPGWYTIENYAKNISRFRITDEKGAALPHTMTRKQTWGVDTKGHHDIEIEFDYAATIMELNQAKITKDFAFFTGTQLFLMAEGHRNSPSTVHFVVPAGWKIISALKETSDPQTFTAPDYDTLVDSPTELGHFDVTRFEVEGKPHYLVVTPAGSLSPERTQNAVAGMAAVASAASAVFGGLPYEKFVYFYFFLESGGGLEHSNSYVMMGAQNNRRPQLASGHEFFHLWNVKRIRPVDLWPYDYSRENDSSLLWVSEGLTEYYGPLLEYRAGLRDQAGFLNIVGNAIGEEENSEARKYLSPSESSMSAWQAYDKSQQQYYTQGENLAALLDLSIRHDTHDASSLDDVMRGLYRECYERGKGFSTEDIINIINRLTKRDYHDFFRRYVSGVEVPPYDTIFGYAGYRLKKESVRRPVFGADAEPLANGRTLKVLSVDPGSPADAAGLAADDVVLKVDNRTRVPFGFYDEHNAGRTLKVTIRRAGEEKELTITLGARDEVAYSLVEEAQPTPEQLKVRSGWLAVNK